jgi:hypothetical protein
MTLPSDVSANMSPMSAARASAGQSESIRGFPSAVIPGWCASTRPQMRNCASGNLEIPGSIPELGFTRVRQIWLSKSATADLDAHRPGMTS